MKIEKKDYLRLVISLIILILVTFLTPTLALAKNTHQPKSDHTYITGKRGGCFYINKNGNKTYVDRSLCRQADKK